MNEVKCPMDYPNPDCNKCPGQFGKEGLCDWPYVMGICPEINECRELTTVLDETLFFEDVLYYNAMLETCRSCKEPSVILGS